jgi:hypothetical protein
MARYECESQCSGQGGMCIRGCHQDPIFLTYVPLVRVFVATGCFSSKSEYLGQSGKPR